MCERTRGQERCSNPINMGICSTDGDCIRSGICVAGHCECPPECTVDADCDSDHACQCPVTIAGRVLSRVEDGNRCVPANCRDATDCARAACGVSLSGRGVIKGFYCRTPSDDCELDSDCSQPQSCRYDVEIRSGLVRVRTTATRRTHAADSAPVLNASCGRKVSHDGRARPACSGRGARARVLVAVGHAA